MFSQTKHHPQEVDPSPLPPLWQRPGWMRAPMLALFWLALVVYGSLLPWGLDISGLTDKAGGVWPAVLAWLSSPQWVQVKYEVSSYGVPNWASDLVLNLLLYGPLGVLLRLTMSRVTGRHIVQIITAGLSVVAISWMIEATQSLIPGRVAAIQDIIANSLGGIVGVLLGHKINSVWRAAAFLFYRKSAKQRIAMNQCMSEPRYRPALMFLVALINAVLIGGWYYLSVHGGESERVLQLVPFREQFARSYDVAAVLLGRSLIVYCLLGGMLMLMLMRGRTRVALSLVMLAVALMAAFVEAMKLISGGAPADVTEPLLALMAGGFVLILGFMLLNACRASCRRREQLPVEVDRRRRGHDYRFALRDR